MIDPSIVSLLKYLKMLTEIHNKVLQLHPNFHLDHIHRKAHGVNCLGMTVLRCLSAESASHLGCGHFGPSSPPRGLCSRKVLDQRQTLQTNIAAMMPWPCLLILPYVSSPILLAKKRLKNHDNSEATRLANSRPIPIGLPVSMASRWYSSSFGGPSREFQKYQKQRHEKIHVKSNSPPFSIIFLDVALLNWNKNGFDKVWLRYLAPSYQNASAGTAWKGSFFEVPPVKNFNALCTFTYQSDQYDLCNWIQRPINHVGVTSLRVDW